MITKKKRINMNVESNMAMGFDEQEVDDGISTICERTGGFKVYFKKLK